MTDSINRGPMAFWSNPDTLSNRTGPTAGDFWPDLTEALEHFWAVWNVYPARQDPSDTPLYPFLKFGYDRQTWSMQRLMLWYKSALLRHGVSRPDASLFEPLHKALRGPSPRS